MADLPDDLSALRERAEAARAESKRLVAEFVRLQDELARIDKKMTEAAILEADARAAKWRAGDGGRLLGR